MHAYCAGPHRTFENGSYFLDGLWLPVVQLTRKGGGFHRDLIVENVQSDVHVIQMVNTL